MREDKKSLSFCGGIKPLEMIKKKKSAASEKPKKDSEKKKTK